MKAQVFKLTEFPDGKHDVQLSFDPVIRYLKERIEKETTGIKALFEYVLAKLEEGKYRHEVITPDVIGEYTEELTLIYTLLVSPISEESEIYWSISLLPIAPMILFGTEAFYKLLQQNHQHSFIQNISDRDRMSKKAEVLYSLILERLYGFEPFGKNNLVYSVSDPKTGLLKYYRIHIDLRFIDVLPKGALPELNLMQLRKQIKMSSTWTLLYDALPLDNFKFEGFSVMTHTDVTAEQTLEDIKTLIINYKSYDQSQLYKRLKLLIKNLIANPDIILSLRTLMKINGKLVFPDRKGDGLIIDQLLEKEHDNPKALHSIRKYFEHPTLIFSDAEETNFPEQKELMEAIKKTGIEYYVIMPIPFNNQVVGIIELYSHKKYEINENVLAKLETAMPLLGQFLKDIGDEYTNRIEDIIRENFTALQPSVQWKFNEMAWKYMVDTDKKESIEPIGTVRFENVYPLYGTTDIKDSTIERNKALIGDLKVQFLTLLDTLEKLESHTRPEIIAQILDKTTRGLAALETKAIDDLQVYLKDFLEVDVHVFLQQFREGDANARAIVAEYDNAMNQANGKGFAQRRALESSMQQLNTSINQRLEQLNEEIHTVYPSYFEKFRTDGVEYDVYVGQSIAPEQPFNISYLKKIRQLQLKAMTDITKTTHDLRPTLSIPLQTTQLIYITPMSIDISFRNDEHRFDVEGSYNIRYHIIKKRIDKAHVKQSGERLTQPGKIALIYSNQKEIEEYKEYILVLQKQNILSPHIEELEVEELQGVSGLKALRVSVLI